MNIHLTDAQRDTFAACGLVVIDGEPAKREHPILNALITGGYNLIEKRPIVAPEGWRILTEPCDACVFGHWCREWIGDDGVLYAEGGDCPNCVGGRRVVTLTATCPKCHGDWSYRSCDCIPKGKVHLGRFTIPALLPVLTDTRPWPRGLGWWNGWILDVKHDPNADTPDGPIENLNDQQLLPDPLPQPGQFIAAPGRVA